MRRSTSCHDLLLLLSTLFFRLLLIRLVITRQNLVIYTSKSGERQECNDVLFGNGGYTWLCGFCWLAFHSLLALVAVGALLFLFIDRKKEKKRKETGSKPSAGSEDNGLVNLLHERQFKRQLRRLWRKSQHGARLSQDLPMTCRILDARSV